MAIQTFSPIQPFGRNFTPEESQTLKLTNLGLQSGLPPLNIRNLVSDIQPKPILGVTPAPQDVSIEDILAASGRARTAAFEPATTIASQIIEAQLPRLRQQAEELASGLTSKAISEAQRRGITGSSTELGTISQTIPRIVGEQLARSQQELLLQALPIAQKEREAKVSVEQQDAILRGDLRKLIGSETLAGMELRQKERLALVENDLKRELTQLEADFKTRLETSRQKFEAARNDADRGVALQELQFTQNEYNQARKDRTNRALFSFIGGGIGLATGGLGGGIIGSKLGESLGFLF